MMASVSSPSTSSNKRRKRPQLRIRLYLSPQAYQKHYQQPQPPLVFEAGDRVYYCSKSSTNKTTATKTTTTGTCCGTIQPDATNDNVENTNNDGKCIVHFDDGSPRQVSTTRLLPIYTVSPHEIAIFITDETNCFRQLAVSQIQGGTITERDTTSTCTTQQAQCDTSTIKTASSSSSSSTPSLVGARVLEIGCSTGETSAILWRQNCRVISSWVGLDTSADMIDKVQKKIATETHSMTSLSSNTVDDACKVHCQRVDALVDSHAAIKAACTFHTNGPTIVFVDIGGNREEVSVLRMLQFLFNAPFPDLHQIIIKSRALCQSLLVTTTTDDSAAFNGRDGFVVNRVDQWLEEHLGRLSMSMLPVLPKHPQKAPIRISPRDNKTPICRYHNYHKNGCHKQDGSCPFDHVHCHFCLQPGHKALDCDQVHRPANKQPLAKRCA